MKPPKQQCNAEVYKWDEDDGEEGDGVIGDGAGDGKNIILDCEKKRKTRSANPSKR